MRLIFAILVTHAALAQPFIISSPKFDASSSTMTLPNRIVANPGAIPASGCYPGATLYVISTGISYVNTNTVAGSCTWTPGTGSTPGGTTGQLQWNNAGAFAGFTMSQDCTIVASTGVITCTKTAGVAFAPSATVDTTNFANITTGYATVAQGGTGAVTLTGLLKGNGTSPFTPAAFGDIFALFSGTCTGSAYPGADGACHTAAGSGTVTSVGLTMPAMFSVGGTNPITTSGTFAVTLATQSANTGLFGPTTGAAAAPTFRALVPADVAAAGTLTNNTTGNAATATAPASTPTTCSAGNYARGIDTSFNATGCTLAATGTVITSGTMAVNSVVVSQGGTTISTPAGGNATLDSSGDMDLGGDLYALNGFWTGPSTGTAFKITAPGVTTTYTWQWPNTEPGAGFVFDDGNGTPSHISTVATIGVNHGGTGATTLTGLLKGNGTSPFTAAAFGDIFALFSGSCTGAAYPGADGACHTPSGAGTVTSVGLTMPGIFSISGPNPITTTGTFAVTLANAAANAVFVGPTSGSPAAPTFRSLVAADIAAAGTLSNNTSGNAGTATQLASAPTLCSGGSAPTGIVANGNSTGCTAYVQGSPLTANQYTVGAGGSTVAVTGAAIVANMASNLATSVSGLPSAGGTVNVNQNVTLSSNVTSSSGTATVVNLPGVTITPSGNKIFNLAPVIGYNGLPIASAEYFTTSQQFMCMSTSDTYPSCSTAGTRKIDAPIIFHGRSDIDYGLVQSDATVAITRATTDNIENTTCEGSSSCSAAVRAALSVQEDYGSSSTRGTAYGIVANLGLHGVVAGRGQSGIASFVNLDASTTTLGIAHHGETDVYGPGTSIAFNAEVHQNAAVASTDYGLLVNPGVPTGNYYTLWSIENNIIYTGAALHRTDFVTNATSTVTSGGGFTSGMVGMYLTIHGKGVFKISAFTSSTQVTINAGLGTGFFPSAGSSLEGWVGTNPAVGYWQPASQGHSIGGLLVNEWDNGGGDPGRYDFFTASFQVSNSTQNIVQLVNAPESLSTNTGFTNSIQFWRGALGHASSYPQINQQNGTLNAELISDITTNADYTQGYFKIRTNIGQVPVDTALFDKNGITSMVGPLKVTATTVSGLGTCNSGSEGRMWGVTDALTPSFLVAVTGGGTTHSPVYCNGSNWVAF